MPIAELQDFRTRYELSGSAGPVLMFSNSLGTDFSMWDPQIAKLSNRFRILRYDTRGHGGTSVTPGDYKIEQLGRDVVALLDFLKIEKVSFCGLSMGGVIGMWLGIHAPERIDHLVVCNTAPKIGTPETWNARIQTVRTDGMKPVAASVVERWYTAAFREAHPEIVDQTRQMLENTSPEGYIGCCAALRENDLRSAISQITAPTLVIYGEKDPVTSATDANFTVSKIRGAKKVGLDAAHLSNVEQSEAFTQSLIHFLSA